MPPPFAPNLRVPELTVVVPAIELSPDKVNTPIPSLVKLVILDITPDKVILLNPPTVRAKPPEIFPLIVISP